MSAPVSSLWPRTKQHTHAKATGRFVKKPKSMLAKPARAAVAVIRSCFTTIKDVVSDLECGDINFGDAWIPYRQRKPAILSRLHRFLRYQVVFDIHMAHLFLQEYRPNVEWSVRPCMACLLLGVGSR